MWIRARSAGDRWRVSRITAELVTTRAGSPGAPGAEGFDERHVGRNLSDDSAVRRNAARLAARRVPLDEEQAAPGVGEVPGVALRAPAAGADQQGVVVGRVHGPDD